MAVNFLSGYTLSRLCDEGCADLLNVETLKHGTQPCSYLQILFNGGRPTEKGMVGSGHRNYRDATQGYFYTFKENIPTIYKLLLPRQHALASGTLAAGYKVIEKIGERNLNLAWVILFWGYGLGSALITPTVNFRFLKEEIVSDRFENDPDYPGDLAYRTKQKIEPWRIGLVGTFLVGLNQKVIERCKENPKRFIKGVIQLTGAAALAWYSRASLSTIAFIAGALLA